MRPILLLLLSATPVAAEVPAVLADTAVIHSLASMVMGDLGTPSLVVPPGTSPHDASLSPSEARALAEADLIVWTGPGFLPWMEESLASLAPDTPQLALLETGGWNPMDLREGVELQDHGEDGHVHAAAHDVSTDPHAWLDPNVAAAWLGHIGEALAKADPANAPTYRANAQEAAAGAIRLGEELRDRLARLEDAPGHAVGHDAYQYFERAMGVPADWTVRDASGLDPAPGDVSSLRDAVLAGEVRCLILDAGTDPAWAETLGEGADLRTAAVDPDGVTLEPGPELYPQLMTGLAAALESCLAPAG